LGLLAAGQLGDGVGTDGVGQLLGAELELDLDRLAARGRAREVVGVLGGDRGGGDLGLVGVVVERAGVQCPKTVGGDGADQYGLGPVAGGLRGPVRADLDGRAVVR